MSDTNTVAGVELAMPWELDGASETQRTAEQSLFDLLGSDPEYAEQDTRVRRKEQPIEEERATLEAEEDDEGEVIEADDLDDSYEEEDEDQQEYEDDDLHVVKVDGEEIEVPYDELINGYSRTEYLTRTRQREAAEHKQRTAEVRQKREEYLQKLDALDRTLEELAPREPDWDTISRTRPNEFPQIFAAYQKQRQTREAIQKEREAEQARQRQDSEAERDAYLTEQVALLQAAVPEWSDQARLANDVRKLQEMAMTRFGFTADELAGIEDHRVFLLLRAASRGAEVQKGSRRLKARQGTRKRALTPSGTKRAQQPRGRRKAAGSKQVRDSAQRLAREGGTVRDAALIFDRLMEDGAEL